MTILKKILKRIKLIPTGYRRIKYNKLQSSNSYITTIVKNCAIKLYPEGQIAELLFTDNFEKEEITIVSEFVKPSYNIIDIGANIGLYSVLFRKISSGNVVCFEPSSESYNRLVRNLALNEIDDIVVHKTALSNLPDQYLELVRKPGYKDGDRHLNTSEVAVDGSDVERVFCTTLDSFFTNGEKVDFIKIDIEGGELNAFKGAENVIRANPTIAIMFECTAHNCRQFGYDRFEVFNLLRSFGLNIYAWDNASSKWQIGEDYMDKTENFWAIKDSKRLPRS